jgi:hypothetical protein
VVAVSQSGESGELCQLIDYWQKQHQATSPPGRTTSGATAGRTISSGMAAATPSAGTSSPVPSKSPPTARRASLSGDHDTPVVLPLLWAITNEPSMSPHSFPGGPIACD